MEEKISERLNQLFQLFQINGLEFKDERVKHLFEDIVKDTFYDGYNLALQHEADRRLKEIEEKYRNSSHDDK